MNETPKISAIYRYPVKGLSPEKLTEVSLIPGQTVPFDRSYAIENGRGRFDKKAPKHLPKINFLMLMRNEKLAALETRFDDQDQSLTIFRDGKQVARGVLTDKIGRQLIEQFFSAYLKDELRGPPRIVFADNHSFSDVAEKCLHIVNLNTVRELERNLGKPVDPLRFRANIYVDDLPAWEELNWVKNRIKLGSVELSVFKRTQRCDATNVDPATGDRDLTIPPHLTRNYGHSDCGVYAMVMENGVVKEGDSITLP